MLRIKQLGGELTFKLERVSYNSGLADTLFDPPRAAEALDVTTLLREVSKNQDAVEKRVTEYSFLRKRLNAKSTAKEW